MLKCLVLDLDNTIWGGVVGEDGVDGIRLTPEYLAVQRAALEIKERGVLLAVCSRNNRRDVEPAFARPEMLLKPTDFAVAHINWCEKIETLPQIARQLNIGLDAIAFADDSQMERGFVRAALPDVTVIDLPNDPAGYAAAIRAVFPDGAVTEEDKKRSGYYSEQKRRMEAEQQAKSKEEFLYSLGLELEVGRADSETIPRIAQLSQRTNQFTLTGRKYSEDELRARLNDHWYRLYWGRLRDKFGDYGIVAAAVVSGLAGTNSLWDFYLSCRAMGRGVESAFLRAINDNMHEVLEFTLTRTDRNQPAIDFFLSLHSAALHAPMAPAWITVRWDSGGSTVLSRIFSIAADTFGKPLDATASPSNTPEWDSLAAINLMLALEDEFGIVFTAEEMEIAPNLQQLAEMIHTKKGRM